MILWYCGDIYSDHNTLVILWYWRDIDSYPAESMAMDEDYASDKFDNLAQKYIMVACCHWVNNSLFLFILQRACSDAKSTVYWWFHSYWTLWSVAECFLVQHPQTTKELAAFSGIGSISAARKKSPVKMIRKCSISIIFYYIWHFLLFLVFSRFLVCQIQPFQDKICRG